MGVTCQKHWHKVKLSLGILPVCIATTKILPPPKFKISVRPRTMYISAMLTRSNHNSDLIEIAFTEVYVLSAKILTLWLPLMYLGGPNESIQTVSNYNLHLIKGIGGGLLYELTCNNSLLPFAHPILFAQWLVSNFSQLVDNSFCLVPIDVGHWCLFSHCITSKSGTSIVVLKITSGIHNFVSAKHLFICFTKQLMISNLNFSSRLCSWESLTFLLLFWANEFIPFLDFFPSFKPLCPDSSPPNLMHDPSYNFGEWVKVSALMFLCIIVTQTRLESYTLLWWMWYIGSIWNWDIVLLLYVVVSIVNV